MSRYYVLAKAEKITKYSSGFPWPYEVAICFDGVDRPIGFSEGVGHGAAGGYFTASEALLPQWRQHIVNAEGDWLIPYIERIANSNQINSAELLQEFRRRHAKDPDTYESSET